MMFGKQRNTRKDLEQAEESLARATEAKNEQQRKRLHEESLMQRLERLAMGNHLAEKFLEAFTERRA